MKRVLAMIIVAISLFLLTSCGSYKSQEIEFTIPAGIHNFVFSGQEISPTGNKITLSSDTAVVVKLSQVREIDSYEVVANLVTPGTPIEIQVKGNTWYKIGVALESPSDVENVVSVEIGGVEVIGSKN